LELLLLFFAAAAAAADFAATLNVLRPLFLPAFYFRNFVAFDSFHCNLTLASKAFVVLQLRKGTCRSA
jgi:hypothetical protein